MDPTTVGVILFLSIWIAVSLVVLCYFGIRTCGSNSSTSSTQQTPQMPRSSNAIRGGSPRWGNTTALRTALIRSSNNNNDNAVRGSHTRRSNSVRTQLVLAEHSNTVSTQVLDLQEDRSTTTSGSEDSSSSSSSYLIDDNIDISLDSPPPTYNEAMNFGLTPLAFDPDARIVRISLLSSARPYDPRRPRTTAPPGTTTATTYVTRSTSRTTEPMTPPPEYREVIGLISDNGNAVFSHIPVC